ncbi:hypothetical protein CB1_000482020 [Camelus ferus]|nr:hypothetical protein CB1_000482020 [Camelus ferus]
MGNVQSEPSAGGGSRKEHASDRSSDSRRTSLVEPEVTPSSPAMRLARGLGVWFPGSSAPPGLLVPPVLNSCPCKCYCRHQPRHRRLPRNVSAWLSTPTNHLSEPPWVATIKLAGSLVAGLEHYDLQATHSN